VPKPQRTARRGGTELSPNPTRRRAGCWRWAQTEPVMRRLRWRRQPGSASPSMGAGPGGGRGARPSECGPARRGTSGGRPPARSSCAATGAEEEGVCRRRVPRHSAGPGWPLLRWIWRTRNHTGSSRFARFSLAGRGTGDGSEIRKIAVNGSFPVGDVGRDRNADLCRPNSIRKCRFMSA
jgi:hypothetical protein